MGELALPKSLSIYAANKALCARIGVRINGVDQERSVAAYDVVAGWARKTDGTVEPYWRW